MDTKVEEPPLQITNPRAPSPSLSSLPDDIVVTCLARISKSQYKYLCVVSKSFYSLLSSPDIYTARSELGATESRLYVGICSSTSTWYTLTIPDQTLINNDGEMKKLSLKPVRLSSSSHCSSPLLNSTVVSVGFEIYEIGGSTVMENRSRAISVLDCRTHTLRSGPNMNVARVYAKSCVIDGKIYVMGGCIKSEEPMNYGEVFDLKTRTWMPVPSPSLGLDFHKVIILEARIYVTTNHKKLYTYDVEEERWKEIPMFPSRYSLDLEDEHIFCIIENVKFDYLGQYLRYKSGSGEWKKVQGLVHLFMDRAHDYITLKLVNYCGKLLIIWRGYIKSPVKADDGRMPYNEKIQFAVIRLEWVRLSSSTQEMWGSIEQSNFFVHRVPKSYKLLKCLSVSL